MPQMIFDPRYPSVPNDSGHGMPQGYPTTYGHEPRYLPPSFTFGHLPYHYITTTFTQQTNAFPRMSSTNSMTMT